MKKTYVFILLFFGFLSLTYAQDNEFEQKKLSDLVTSKIPKLKGHIQHIEKTNIWELYEIDTDDRQVIYTDKNVTYLFAGDIYLATNLQNLTQTRIDKLNAVSWSELPLAMAIKRVKGNGKRQLALFSDPDCPYCRRLESELAKINDVTIYTFVYPIASLHPNAPQRSQEIWCAKDPAKAWEDYLLKKIKASNRVTCDLAALEKTQVLAEKLNITGTPTLIFKTGQRVPGVISANDLEKLLGPH